MNPMLKSTEFDVTMTLWTISAWKNHRLVTFSYGKEFSDILNLLIGKIMLVGSTTPFQKQKRPGKIRLGTLS